MKKLGARQMIPMGGLVFSAVFMYAGLTQLGFWGSKGPLPGFFPVIMSVVFGVSSFLALLQSAKEDSHAMPKDAWTIILAVTATICAHLVIGLVPSLLLFVILWLKLVEKATWAATIKVLAIVAAVVIGVFQLWLKIRFPAGVLGAMLVGLF